MKSLSSKTYQCGVTIQGLTTLSGTVYLTGITNTASWDHVIVGTTAQGQIYTRTYAQFMSDVAAGISLSSYVTGSGTTNYLPKFTGGSALGNSQIFDNGTNVGIGTTTMYGKLSISSGNFNGIRIDTNGGGYSALNIGGTGALTVDAPGITGGRFQITDSGNVGIGTPSPREKLQIVGNTVIGSAGLNSYKTNLYLTYNAGADETWVRIYVPQDYNSSNNGGTIRVRVLWEGDHATFGAYQDYQISYKTFYPSSPYLKFSNVLCTNKTSDFNTGSSYYPASSTPDVLFYDNSDGYLYVKVKGTHTAYNTARYIEAEIFGRTTAQPTIATTSAPGAPVELTKTIQFLPQEGNIYASGSIGIGTTGPSQKLHLYGSGNQLMFIENTGTYHMYTGLSSNVGIVGSGNATPLSLQTNGVSRVYLDTGGNVGIGTTTPLNLLHVSQPSANTIFRLGNNASYDQFIYFNGGNDWSLGMDYSNSNAFVLSNASSIGTNDRLVVTTGGNVGIGTASPGAKLTVKSPGEVGSYGDGFVLERNGTSAKLIRMYESSADGFLEVRTGGDSIVSKISGYSGTPSYFLSNVGIGTTSPSQKLDVQGDISVGVSGATTVHTYYNSTTRNQIVYTNNSSFEFHEGANERVRIAAGGNVGIGTTAPLQKLHVVTTATAGLSDLTNIDRTSTNLIRFTNPQYSTVASMGILLRVFPDSDTRQGAGIIASGGTNNSETNLSLFVSKDVPTSLSNSYAALTILGNNGNVGIGTTSPGYKLNVIGTLGVTGDTTIGGNIAGARTLNLISSDNAVTYDINFQQYGTSVFGRIRYEEAASDFQFYAKSDTDPNLTLQWGGNSYFQRGNVGIGTTSPAAKLDVAGDIRLGGTATYNSVSVYNNSASGGGGYLAYQNGVANAYFGTAGWYIGNSDTGAIIGTDSASRPIRFYTNTEKMRIAGDGNVGIGTSGPNEKLTVWTASTTGLQTALRLNNPFGFANQNTGSQIVFSQDRSTAEDLKQGIIAVGQQDAGTSASSYMAFSTNNTGLVERMRITSGGNVGIGTTSPASKLDVNGSIQAGSGNTFGIGTNGASIYMSATSSVGLSGNLAGYSRNLIKTDGTSVIEIGDTATSIISAINISAGDATGVIALKTGGNNTRLYINSAGNVGIGTVSPSRLFDVSAVNPQMTLKSTTTTGFSEYYFSDSAGDPGYLSYAHNGDYLAIGVNSAERMRITAGGNLGIGTTNPAYTLDVNGSFNALTSGVYLTYNSGIIYHGSSYYQFPSGSYYLLYGRTGMGLIFGSNNAEVGRFDLSGNLGIGTSSPSTKLDVSGVITATGGNSTNWNTAYGWGNHASANYVPQARTLTINGTSYDLSANRSWTIATTTPGGSDTQVQYNSSGSLAGASALTYNSTTNRVGINQASPGYDLDVNGQVRVQDKLRVGTGNGVVHMSSTATINASATTVVWAQTVSVGMCAFIEYYILNSTSLTDQRAGTIIVTWNQSGTPTITHTETTTPDIGSTTTVNFTSSLVGSDARINAVNSSANPYTMVMSYKYF